MNELVEAARSYLGVKWRHRGRSRHGIDCAGLVVLSYADCGVELKDFTQYGREPHQDGLITHMTAALGEPLEQPVALMGGDVIVQKFDKEPHHVGILAAVMYAGMPALNIIHADGHVGRVVEVRLDGARMRQITHVYRRAV